MPAIRDFSYAYSTSTSGTTVVCDVPYTETGDVLVAICSADTGTPTWTCTGWTQIYTLTNTVNTAFMWRMSTGTSEPATYTFTSSTAETLNVTIISIRDVDQVAPIGLYSQTNRAANNTEFISQTSSFDNSLSLFISSHGTTATAIPSTIEGPVTQLWQWDGSAHADCIAWTVLPTAGVGISGVTSSVTGTTYNGKLISIIINPPSTGATVVPAYCAQDLSKYVDPLHGTTAFRGNTAFAATATTYFGTTLNGKTLANATVTTRTDYGLNTYRSTAGINSSTNRTWVGASLVLAAGNVLTTAANKNILCHVMPLLPADLQTAESVGLQRGVAFGAYTSANNFKVWQVHGAGTSWGVNRVPVIINTGATAGVKHSTGTLNENSIAGFGFFASGFTASADWHWTMLWVLDTTTVAGGTSLEPVDVAGVTRAAATGHERMSVLQQGSNQMLVLQPLQFGNGGTNPIYLDLSTAAIEFPEQYNLAKSTVYYNSIDNVAGVTFYLGANDTVNLSSCTFSSVSKFHWRIHPSSNSSATYNLDGMNIIGAGDVVLYPVTTFSNVSFNSCFSIQTNQSNIDNCSFSSSNIHTTDFNHTNSTFEDSKITVTLNNTDLSFTSNNSFVGYSTSNWLIDQNISVLLPFENKSALNEYSKTNKNISISKIVATSTASVVDFASSSYGTALKVSGVSGTAPFILFNNTALTTSTGDFTVEGIFWLYGDNGTKIGNDFPLVVLRTSDGAVWPIITIGHSSNNTIIFPNGTAPFNYTIGQKYHFAYTRQSGVGTMYIDGVSVGSAANTTDFTGYINIASGESGGNRNFVYYANDLIFTDTTKSSFTEFLYKKTPYHIKGKTSGTLTINVTGGDVPTFTSYVTVNTVVSNSFVITNIVPDSEVRIFRTSDQVELCGVERIGTDTPSNCTVADDPDNAGRKKLTYSHGETSLSVYVVVTKTDYQHYYQSFTLTNSTQGLLVSQITDRNFKNT